MADPTAPPRHPSAGAWTLCWLVAADHELGGCGATPRSLVWIAPAVPDAIGDPADPDRQDRATGDQRQLRESRLAILAGGVCADGDDAQDEKHCGSEVHPPVAPQQPLVHGRPRRCAAVLTGTGPVDRLAADSARATSLGCPHARTVSRSTWLPQVPDGMQRRVPDLIALTRLGTSVCTVVTTRMAPAGSAGRGAGRTQGAIEPTQRCLRRCDLRVGPGTRASSPTPEEAAPDTDRAVRPARSGCPSAHSRSTRSSTDPCPRGDRDRRGTGCRCRDRATFGHGLADPPAKGGPASVSGVGWLGDAPGGTDELTLA